MSKLAREVNRTPKAAAQILHDRLPDQAWVQRGGHTRLLASYGDEARRVLQEVGTKIDAPSRAPSGYQTARARREEFQARKVELEVKRLESELLPTEAVVKWYTEAVKRTSMRILQVPQQLCASLVGLDAGQIQALLESELRAALRELRGEIEGVQMVREADLDAESAPNSQGLRQ